ncbi:MAG: thioredoxin [Rhizobiales bacterium]|nr:thioredoxin [Hyphomicrobiales bacterium]MBA69067.1 thioredoxin [Hyphomicrobiales bacterium]|tara:strand:+ start:619 stop:1608 length:990 start_codon:yes stop_codon:yes gene_type:complete
MSNSDNPFAPAPGSQMTGTVTFGDASPAAASQQAVPAGALVSDTTTADFTRDVMEASRRQPVLVDFWAPWCGPCKQLTPVLEKVVTEAAGAVKLVKLNIDDHPAIPGQMGIQSIPAVIAFVDGRPVDGFMGAVPESEVRNFIAKLGGQADQGPDPRIAATMEQADAALAAGQIEGAAQLYSAVLSADPDHAGAMGGLANAMIAAGALDQAQELMDQAPEELRGKPELASAAKKLELAREVASLGNPAELEARIAADDRDFEARLQLAKILNAQGEREKAVEQVFAVMRRDRGWNDEAARKQLLEFFEAWGPADPVTASARRQLSSFLFS